jgi:predicted enzyme related to lactoylglutathione lyase
MLKNPQSVHLTLRGVNMRAQWISIPVDDQARALKFYTDRLGFMPKVDVPVGDDARWLTVVSPEDPDGVEVVLEPKGHPAADDFTAALKSDGVPLNQFAVDDVQAEFERLTALGVAFTQEPKTMGPVTTAILDDTVGNLIQLIHVDEATAQPPEA